MINDVIVYNILRKGSELVYERKKYAGDLMLEAEEIKNMDEKEDGNARVSFTSMCSHILTIICC